MLDVNNFDSMRIGLASPEGIRKLSHGEVVKPETINYRTLKPERDGLFCEKIFGPTRDWECHCGKFKRIRYKGIICDRCGVEVTRSKVRRERMGHIELAAPVSHVWYFKGIPSRMGLVLDMTPRELEKILYFASFVVIDPGETPLVRKQLLSEMEYREYRRIYGDAFRAGIGAEAVKTLLAEVDLEQMTKELRKEFETATGQRKNRAIKRLDVTEAFRRSGNKPEWMVLDVVPVIPPEIRPMVQLDGGRFATSDLNDLYRRVINRNNRLKRLLLLCAPDIIIRNEKRMLQEAVDALIDNGRRGRPVTGPGNRPLKSLSDMLKGKQGRFRQNLLGKRVDYSGRSVIVVGPNLKLNQCGVPKEMALELFKPFVMRKLVQKELAHNIKSAKRMVERMRPEVWDVLEDVIREHPVMLNRAPTLHRLGIQAFEPVLSEGRALKIHPLVCAAYNADFDGDQMAIHVPLSVEAQAEARLLMMATNNILSPKDGKPIVAPTQDMILGMYYLTIERDDQKGDGRFFSDSNEVMMAYDSKEIELHAKITLKIPGRGLVRTTCGRLIFNEVLPLEMQQYEAISAEEKAAGNIKADWRLGMLIDKKKVGRLVFDCYRKLGGERTAVVLDDIKRLGFSFACRAGITMAIDDVKIPAAKQGILKIADEKVTKFENMFRRGLMTENERYRNVVEIWRKATDDVTEELVKNNDQMNPIMMMANSGARGSINQTRQLAGMRGLMADTSGKTIDVPIKANFREGLTVLEFFTSTHGARKGLADTALRTADSGYLTRRLVDVAQDVIVREEDCDVVGLSIQRERNHLLSEYIYDNFAHVSKVLDEDVFHPETGELLISGGVMLDEAHIDLIVRSNVTDIFADGEGIYIGESVKALIIGTLIREMLGKKTASPVLAFDDNGIEYVLINEGVVLKEAEFEQIWLHNVREVVVRNNNIKGIEVVAIKDKSKFASSHKDIVSLKDRIVGRIIAETIVNPDTKAVIATINEDVTEAMADEIIKYRDRVRIRTILTCKSRHGICTKCYGRNLANGKAVEIGEAVGVIAAQSIGEPGTQLTMRTFHTGGVSGVDDITQGLPRIEELFEARKPKRCTVLAEISGAITVEDINDLKKITITAENGMTRIYAVPVGSHMAVKTGATVIAGDKLTEGAINPHDILKVSGLRATQNYILEEVQKVYRDQGVEINDKHIEVIVRQMLRKVKIEEPGTSQLLPGENIDINDFEEVNVSEIIRDNGEPAVSRPLLLGITKASLATDSFLSAASFQETSRVLTDAAIKGKIDYLFGLKENVIIGKLIPAGTGMTRYRSIKVIKVRPDREADYTALK
ncbi:MAG: DNA-directed RNA polymerase subunit beta' [Bacillota bacterium]